MTMAGDPVVVVEAFNAAINGRDVDALGALMPESHRFVDAAGGTVAGRAACLAAWQGFFAAYPSYRNHFGTLTAGADGVVTVTGHSTCAEEPALDGPARWRAVVVGDRVAEWRVTDPAPG